MTGQWSAGHSWTVVSWIELDSGQLDSDWTVVNWTELDSGHLDTTGQWSALDSD